MHDLRVMTYNIWMGGRGGTDLDRVVRAADPDVVLVNEAPKAPLTSRRRCRALAERWDLAYVVGGRSAGSNLIVASPRVAVKTARAEVLRQPMLQPRRGVASAQLRVRGRLVGVVCCHLSLDDARRLREVDDVLRAAAALRGPVVVAGDLNERPDGPAWHRLRAAGFADHGSSRWRTFPAAEPRARIDALLVRGAEVTRHGSPGVGEALLGRASDHRPVLAELRW